MYKLYEPKSRTTNITIGYNVWDKVICRDTIHRFNEGLIYDVIDTSGGPDTDEFLRSFDVYYNGEWVSTIDKATLNVCFELLSEYRAYQIEDILT